MAGGSFFSRRSRCALAGVASAVILQATLLGLLAWPDPDIAPGRNIFARDGAGEVEGLAAPGSDAGNPNVHKADRMPPPALAPSAIPPIVKVLRRQGTSRHAEAAVFGRSSGTQRPILHRQSSHVAAAIAVANAADLKRLCRLLL